MNVENVNKLIEATRECETFDFQDVPTCFLGVARDVLKLNGDGSETGYIPYVGSLDLGEWLGLTDQQANELAFAYTIKVSDGEWDAIDKAHALRTLEHLKATGTVDWKATQ